MATLTSESMALEITFPGSRAETVSYQFRVTWYGEDFIRHEVRFDTPSPENTPFYAWDSQKDRLCGAIEAALTKNRPQYWEPVDPFISMAIFPGGASLWQLYYQTTEKGRQEPETTANELSANPHPEDFFTVILQLRAEHHLIVRDPYAGGGEFGFSLHSRRGELERFLSDLRRELEASPQFPPSPDDVLWRMIH